MSFFVRNLLNILAINVLAMSIVIPGVLATRGGKRQREENTIERKENVSERKRRKRNSNEYKEIGNYKEIENDPPKKRRKFETPPETRLETRPETPLKLQTP